MTPRPPAVLLAASYGVQVGYAWNNIFELYKALARAFHAQGLRVCLSFRDLDGPASAVDPGVPFDTFQYDPRRATRRVVAGLRQEIAARDIRYLYTTDQPVLRWDYPWLRASGVRAIVTHNRISVPDPEPARPVRGARGLARRVLTRLPWASVDRVFAVSDFVRARLIAQGTPPSRVRTFLNGIDVDAWRFPERPLDVPIVTFFAAARAARYKGVPDLIEAAALLRSRHGIDGFRVRFAGDGPDLEAFRALIAARGLGDHVEMLGKLPQTRDGVRDADVVVVPSAYGDACPSTVSEALASGRPLIATRAGGIPELVGDAGNARLVPPRDPAALAAAMASLIGQPEARRALGRSGRRRAETALRQDAYHASVTRALFEEFRLTPPSGGPA
jgi:glycosyltransferase involved in cell wall biosynthesis